MATLWNKMNNKDIYVEICKMMYWGIFEGEKIFNFAHKITLIYTKKVALQYRTTI